MMNTDKIRYLIAGMLIQLSSMAAFSQIDLLYQENQTVTWEQAIAGYQHLADTYKEARLTEIGETDVGKPLHLFIISLDQVFRADEVHAAGKGIMFINNGIHPGEPCGVDASLKLAEELLSGKDDYRKFLENTIILIVPVFNVGGALNRGSYFRANQNGPEEHGFRGNARNLDLNRDFIKLDSRNTRSLVSALREWEPDIFVDTHTSDGADYPYVITLINSPLQKLEPAQAGFLEETMLPGLFKAMDGTPYELAPYIWSYKRTPESGITGFFDYPRYTAGYASLFNTLAFTTETHMFKPFADRVLSTWYFLREMVRFASIYKTDIQDTKLLAREESIKKDTFTLVWEPDTTRFDMIRLKGYTSGYVKSNLTGKNKLHYDRTEPWERSVPYYRYFEPVVTVSPPDYYVIPQAWDEVIQRLRLNHADMWRMPADTLLKVQAYYIENYRTTPEPYNGHYWHYDVRVREITDTISFLKGDYIVPTRQEAIEYLVQTLEPQGYDSFFSWNFFDAILFRNEYFSPYIFDETAERLLAENPGLKKEFQHRLEKDSAFASSSYSQLRYIYEHSPYAEKTYRRYPVFKLNHSE